MKRRLYSLLATVTATLLGTIFCPRVNAELINLAGGGNFSITAKQQDVTIGGNTVHAMIYEDDNNPLNVANYPNGIPVPVMRLTVGQMVTCHFTSLLPDGQVPEGASIHWHGLELDNDSDGTAVTQDSLKNGQSYTYRFIAPRPGLYWFHSHMVPGDTLFAGMYGVIIVTSPCEDQLVATNGLPGAAATFTLAMTDIEFLTNSVTNADSMVYPSGTVGKIMIGGGDFHTINDWIHLCGQVGGGGQTGGGQMALCTTASFPGKTVLVNGYDPIATPAPVTFSVQAGQMIRLHLLDEALTRSFYLKLDPTNTQQLIRIGGQGGLLNNARLEGGIQNGWNTLYDSGAILISSGMRSDVVTTIPAGATNGQILTLWGEPLTGTANQWPLMQQITKPYPVAYFQVTGAFGGTNPAITNGAPLLVGTNCMVPNLTNGVVTFTNFITPAPFGGSSASTITLSQASPAAPGIDTVNIVNANIFDGNDGNGTAWTKSPPQKTSRYAHIGDLLQLTVANTTGAGALAHPFHLHGFSMQPVSMAGHAFGYNEFLDTIDVYAGQSYVFNVLIEDRPRFCDTSSGTPPAPGPILAPCLTATNGGALGRWLFHCHIAAHGVLGMMSEVVILDDTPQQPIVLQPPDATPTGVDVQATKATGSQTVADDFQWTTNGPITGITIWGSWTNDLPDPNASFELKFWTDVPSVNGPPSRPGWQAWRQMFPAGTYTNSLYASNIFFETFYDPSNPSPGALGTDSRVFQYDFRIPQLQAFTPQPGATNWVSVTAYTAANTFFFGWKTCVIGARWNDDASWSPTLYGPPWTDLHYPPTHPFSPQSMDMAFQLSGPAPAQQSRPAITQGLPVLSATAVGGMINISWSNGGILQYADNPTGPWNDIGGTPNPYVTSASVPHRYYRVRVPQ